MTLKNLIHNDKEVLKNSSPSQKLQFFLDYYKWHAIAVVIVLCIVGSFVHSAVTAKDIILSGITLNCYHMPDETPFENLEADFLRDQQMDPSKYEIEINSSLVYAPGNPDTAEETFQTVQRIGVQIASFSLDFMVGNLESMTEFAYSQSFADLSTLLTQEQLTLLKDSLVYIDLAVLESPEYDPQNAVYPDCTNPEAMQNPVPVLIDVSSSEYLMNSYAYLNEPLVFGIAVNAPHEEQTLALLNMLLDL